MWGQPHRLSAERSSAFRERVRFHSCRIGTSGAAALAAAVCRDSEPQGLKHHILATAYGTTEVVPFPLYSFIPVHGFHGEGWQADGDVFGAAFLRSGVAHPFAGAGKDCLAGGDVKRSTFVFDAQQPLQHDRELVELRRLAGLEPSLRTAHVGDAGGGGFRIDASDVFVDEFGLVAGGLNSRGVRDEYGHEVRASGLLEAVSGHKITTKAFTAEVAKEARSSLRNAGITR